MPMMDTATLTSGLALNMPPSLDAWLQPMLIPAILTFFGGLVWFLGWNKERMGAKRSMKLSAYGFFVLALFLGARPFYDFFFEPFYRNAVDRGTKMTLSHTSALVIPLIGLLVAIVWHVLDVRRKKLDPYG